MQVARANFVNKTAAFSSLTRNTSCSRGWFRLMMQTIFAVITTASFILIVLMAVKNPTHSPTESESMKRPRCILQSCRVVCKEAPYYGQYEEDILDAVADIEAKCSRVILELNYPLFINNTLPNNWMAKMRTRIYELSIKEGNLNHLPSEAFISQFTGYTKILSLQGLNLKTWNANSLVGLSRLETLNILNCEIDCFESNSLQAVDDTLKTLSITNSGYWDPKNVTGSRGFEKLVTVDFSNNEFSYILGRNSFVGLEYCKFLYLNSCGIVSIGAGAFDHLSNIEVIYLNNNLLVTVPTGIFDNIVLLESPRPRISLHENFWDCNCSVDDLRQLVRKEILLVEGICTYPSTMNGKTFTEFDNVCANDTKTFYDHNVQSNASQMVIKHASYYDNKVYVNGICRNNNSSQSPGNRTKFRLISPQYNKKCSINNTKVFNVSLITSRIDDIRNSNNSYWLKFSFFLKSAHYNAIHIGAAATKDYGLLWFQSDCPDEIYCINFMPSFLRIYNVEKSRYTFCPMRLSTGNIEDDSCFGYVIMDDVEKSFEYNVVNWFIYTTTVLFCICFGAVIVYGLIRKNPTLLKGSKRILFVKHKTVDALVLPPKVPLRNELINGTEMKDKEIFTVCVNDKLKLPKIIRMKSVRSNKSSSPSYISPLQPSEDQLAEWRISHHFNNDLTVSSKSELSTLSWIGGDTSYNSLDESDKTYESLTYESIK